ncbi:hypothetical protein [Herbiconiux ginsengi]|uniref:Uncharacterized protein n=1 Tax=Herbiconiux ginsengi TaxID=381665 RepID=A0A1H3K4V7_9MICO|nr:hypothetical protein [Herbiconiux ginsengi]SDY47232.1 hypothetical protein SAMN05216554_0427 [Herbiconiux ginsengi]
MPFRTKETLERWVGEFGAAGHDVAGTISVLDHDDDAGGTGLVVVHLEHVPIDVYLEPLAPGDPHWTVTFTRRDVDVTMDAARLAELVAELTIASELCTFLEARSMEYVVAGRG